MAGGSFLFLQGSKCVHSLCVYMYDPGSNLNHKLIYKNGISCEYAFNTRSILMLHIARFMVLITIYAINGEYLWSLFYYR